MTPLEIAVAVSRLSHEEQDFLVEHIGDLMLVASGDPTYPNLTQKWMVPWRRDAIVESLISKKVLRRFSEDASVEDYDKVGFTEEWFDAATTWTLSRV